MKLIPFRHDCSENIRDYKFAVQCYREAMHAPEPVRIELGNVELLRPFGLNLLSGMIYDLLRRGQDVSLTPPQNERVNRYLTNQGFFNEFLVQQYGRLKRATKSTSVGLRRLDELDYTYLSSVAYWLNKHSQISIDRIQDMVMLTLPEIINNVFDHSASPFGCYVCAEAYPSEHRLMLSVVDFGVGFYQSLSPTYRQLNTDAEAIELAVKPGISSKTKKNNAGRGLYILSDWARQCEGDLEIISLDGHWKQSQNGMASARTLPYDFPGSCINLCVHTVHLPMEQDNEPRRYD